MEALAGDGEGHLVPTPVRREKIKASKRELALEADRVLKQADSVSSMHTASPPRRQQRSKPDGGGSLRRKTSFGGTDSTKWNSEGKYDYIWKIVHSCYYSTRSKTVNTNKPKQCAHETWDCYKKKTFIEIHNIMSFFHSV